MRRIWGMLAGIGFLAACLPVLAQTPAQQQASSFFTGVNPRNIQSKNLLVQPGKGMKNYNLNQTMRKQPQSSVFNVNKVFPKITLGTWPPVVPSIPVLSTKNNPFQPNPPRGVNLFDPPAKK